MKNYFVLLFSVTISVTVWGQQFPFWGHLKAGEFLVGYSDTITYNEHQSYTFQDYHGAKPYIVSMWYPLVSDANDAAIFYEDYFVQSLPNGLNALGDSLAQMQRTSLINYGIKNRLDAWEDRAYGDSEKQLLSKMIRTQVNARKSAKRPTTKYPVVIYHHGMGGIRNENAVLFEYLASHGFIVLSSNYHWPNQSTVLVDLIDDLRFVTNFTTTLPFVDETELYFLGHSWGAQIGLILNQSGDHPFKSFILLDNTLEALTSQQVSRYYPELDSIFRNHPRDFKTKTYVVTSQKTYKEDGEYVTTPEPKFESFKLLDIENFEFLVINESLSHEAFTSNGVIRNIFGDQIYMDDSASSATQYETYLELNQTLLNYFKEGEFDKSLFLREIEWK